MNRLILNFRQLFLLVSLTLFSALAWAQEEAASTSSSVSTTTTTSTERTWYTEPWVWIVGGAVFLLLLIALMRGGGDRSGRTDRVTVSKTIKTDTDV